MDRWRIVGVVLAVGLMVSVVFNVLIYQAADNEIAGLKHNLSVYKNKYSGIKVNGSNILIYKNRYLNHSVIIREHLINAHVITIKPGHMVYTCFNYDVWDTRLTIIAKELDKTPVDYYIFDYDKLKTGARDAVILGGTFTGANQTYYLNRVSAMETGRVYCVGFKVPTQVFTTEGTKDVATNAKIWANISVEAHINLYPANIMGKR